MSSSETPRYLAYSFFILFSVLIRLCCLALAVSNADRGSTCSTSSFLRLIISLYSLIFFYDTLLQLVSLIYIGCLGGHYC